MAPHLLEYISELHIVYLTLYGLASNYATPPIALDPPSHASYSSNIKRLALTSIHRMLNALTLMLMPQPTMAFFSPTHSSCDLSPTRHSGLSSGDFSTKTHVR